MSFLRLFLAVPVVSGLLSLGAISTAGADVHTVVVNEYYTQCDNGSTSVQYIEFRSATLGNFFRQCASIQIKRTVAGGDVFFAKPVFAGHADGEVFANGKTFLIATPGFQSLTGVTPDLMIPDGTLNPAGGVIRFAADSGCALNFGTIHEVRYGDQGLDPAPGPNQAANFRAISRTFTLGATSPRNFADSSTSSWSCAPVPVEPSTWGGIKALYPN